MHGRSFGLFMPYEEEHRSEETLKSNAFEELLKLVIVDNIPLGEGAKKSKKKN